MCIRDSSYINPEKKDKDVFAINVLKTLFMIKYVLEIEANIDNITSMMIENIDDDRIELKGRVEEALKVLMRQVLVQKNGSIYVDVYKRQEPDRSYSVLLSRSMKNASLRVRCSRSERKTLAHMRGKC